MSWYLYDHQNPHAPRRANGKRFWGYPTRSRAVQLVAVHTTESLFDLIGADGGAESVARYQASTDRPSSYHRIVDRDSLVPMLPDEATSFGVVGYNSRALNLSFAMRAADWSDPAKAKAAEPALHLAARQVAEWCAKHGIPVRLITKAQADAGARGITSHGRLDPARRSDPGSGFPWERFLALVQHYLVGAPPADTDTTQEDDVRQIFTYGNGQFAWPGGNAPLLELESGTQAQKFRAAGYVDAPPLNRQQFEALKNTLGVSAKAAA